MDEINNGADAQDDMPPPPKFSTGKWLIEFVVYKHLYLQQIIELLRRHAYGEWDNLSESRLRANELALRITIGKIISLHECPSRDPDCKEQSITIEIITDLNVPHTIVQIGSC